MKNLKKVKKNKRILKKILKKNKIYQKYKNTFQNKQMIFLLSKITTIFCKNLNFEKIAKYEINLINKKKNFEMFDEFILFIKENAGYNFQNAKWKDLSNYLFFIYQISSYFYDKKNYIPNIYNESNFNYLNTLKRKHFGIFAESLLKLNFDFNLWIKQILKWVL